MIIAVLSQTDNGQSSNITKSLQKLVQWRTLRNVPTDPTVSTVPLTIRNPVQGMLFLALVLVFTISYYAGGIALKMLDAILN